MIRLRTVVVVVTIGALVVGPQYAHGAPVPSRVLFALFDVSGSASGQRAQYRKDFDRIIGCSLDAGLKRTLGGQRVVGDRITANPLATSEFRINDRITPYDPLRVTRMVYMGQARRIVQKADGILRANTEPERGTKIMEALQLAERVFRTYAGDQKILVVFSDMYEQSERYDFTAEALTGERTGTIIRLERSDGRLPDLGSVKVYVVRGPVASATAGSSGRSFAIMNFWLRYFTAAGADLTKDRYGSALLAFEGC